jgi:hypothetical protein
MGVWVTLSACVVMAGSPEAGAAAAETREAAEIGAPRRPGPPAAAIGGGHDKTGAWMVAEYRDLKLQKRSERKTGALAIEFQSRGDVVSISLSQALVTVARGNRHVVVDSVEAFESVQQLLGSSPAVFALRGMLSELEPVSTLHAPEMSLLSAAAFVASLVGDTGAPQRIADRFVEKHRGLLRQVRMPGGSCWSAYSGETTVAWNELQDCMRDADDKEFFRAAYERIACNAIWVLRTESAWFEYLNCLSPLSGISK